MEPPSLTIQLIRPLWFVISWFLLAISILLAIPAFVFFFPMALAAATDQGLLESIIIYSSLLSLIGLILYPLVYVVCLTVSVVFYVRHRVSLAVWSVRICTAYLIVCLLVPALIVSLSLLIGCVDLAFI